MYRYLLLHAIIKLLVGTLCVHMMYTSPTWIMVHQSQVDFRELSGERHACHLLRQHLVCLLYLRSSFFVLLAFLSSE